MSGSYNQVPSRKIDFLKQILNEKIRQTHQPRTYACVLLSKSVHVSHVTLLNILNKGKVTVRTVGMMIKAGWFSQYEYDCAGVTHADYNNKKRNKTQYTPPKTDKTNTYHNDTAQQKDRENAAFKRGYDQGKTDSSKSHYTVGYNAGYHDGLTAATNKSNHVKVTSNSGIPVDKLTGLFNLNLANGAAPGEVNAARIAAGKVLAKWIKEKFGQNVEVKVS